MNIWESWGKRDACGKYFAPACGSDAKGDLGPLSAAIGGHIEGLVPMSELKRRPVKKRRRLALRSGSIYQVEMRDPSATLRVSYSD